MSMVIIIIANYCCYCDHHCDRHYGAIVVIVMFDMFIIFKILINNMLSRIEQMIVFLYSMFNQQQQRRRRR